MSNKVPQIRFKGFTDPWEQRKLGDLLKEFSIKSKIEDEHKVLSSTNSGMEFREGRVSGTSNLGYKIIKNGDLVLSPQNLWLGNININNIGKGLVSPSYKTFELINIDSSFINPQLRTQKMLEEYKNSSTQGASVVRRNLEIDSFYQIKIFVPTISEQGKIGSFFQQLDNTIVLHQRKLAKIKELKQGYLQKMFPKNGAKVPELRFAGFADDWEERKLGDLATSFEYGLNATAKSFDGTHKYIRITDIDDSSRKFNSQSLTSPDIDLSSADNYKLKNGDILFARTGASVGKSYIYADSDGLVYYAGFLIRARIKSGVDSNFVFQHTLTSSYENFIRVTSQRSGQPGVNAKEYSTFEISVPSYEEQQKIGSFFKQLDDTIALHQRKLDLLKEQKKGFLQKMFV
ncbi:MULTISPECIES: restriction endonuclease subunit S [Bacilli]|jgi:type I restriction enzyme S subunit|uniref:restriction endonuclease subunit S n=1 Tax=Bacilli TaxID=91061 RepID=UPI002432931D|nr:MULTISPECIES: restriction endonuclease subunit S [Bacilli]MCI1764395.1 restriction endonuclease subunit S [Heyndrickxia oleronia]MEC5141448.1 restriction endonuclease subunit S [Pediococcus pentosaceus]